MHSLPLVALLASALTNPAAPTAPVRTITITARNYAYDIPDTIAAGRTQIVLHNKGTELHHATLIRLDGGHTMADFVTAMKKSGPPPTWTRDVGGPNTPVPGGSSTAVLDLTPGTYAVVCFIPSTDGQPHLMKGMMKAMTVVDPARLEARAPNVTVPAPDVTLTLVDYGFNFSTPLTAGKHMLRIVNGGQQSHEMVFVRLAPGKTAKDVVAWAEKVQGPPPGEPLGGIASMSKGLSNDIPLDLKAGTYALLCFVPDAKDGKPHVAHGMAKEIAVK